MYKWILAAMTGCAVAALAIANAAAAGQKSEHFSLIHSSTNPRPVFSAIATGAFTAGGTATETKKPRKEIILRFPAGTITLTSSGRGHSRVKKHHTASACLEARRASGKYSIAGGTGAYKGISGSGTVTHHETFVVAAKGGHCTSKFLAIQAIITASGPVSLP